MRRYLTEAIGTFILVLAVGLGGDAIATGLVLAAMVMMGIHVSGAHFNPAISFAFLLKRELDFNSFTGYIIAQILGAFAAAGLLLSLSNMVFYVEPPTSTNLYEHATAEVIFTFVLAIVYLTLVPRSTFKNFHIHGLAIGLVLAGITITSEDISGAVFNPAISLGTSALDYLAIQGQSFRFIPLYTIAPLAGATMAAFFYRYLNE